MACLKIVHLPCSRHIYSFLQSETMDNLVKTTINDKNVTFSKYYITSYKNCQDI